MKLPMVVIFAALAMFTLTSSASGEESYSPYTSQTFPDEVYWGDTHLHTNLSNDAQFHGYRKLGPREAYRFARGEVITTNNGMKARLKRSLDFLVVADHAETMGLLVKLELSDPVLLKTKTGRSLHSRYQKIKDTLSWSNPTDPDFVRDIMFSGSVWGDKVQEREGSPL